MNYDKYVSLIKSLEPYAAANRRGYELRVFGLAVLGYAYFFGLIALFLAVPLAVAAAAVIYPSVVLRILLWTAKLWWAAVPVLAVFFGFLGGAVKALFTNVPEPEERELPEADAPELYEFVRSTCKALDAKVPEKVFITDEFNAAVVTMPRFGIFGNKVYLRLGLPVMKALSPEQFKAVLAHEIGHISGKHGGFGRLTYQLHDSWGRFIESQDLHDQKFSALYDRFVKWFFPYFQAYSFVLMREHEKEADEYAVQVVGAKPLGDALVSLDTRSAALEQEFWPRLHEENRTNPTPAKDVFSRMLGALSFADPHRDALTIEKALKVPTDYNDTHPSLADRLRKIGYWDGGEAVTPPVAGDVTAAQYFLGDRAETYVAEFEGHWSAEMAKTWAERHEHFKTSQGRIDELETKAAAEGLCVEELIEMAGLVAEQKGNREAMPLLREAHEREPDNPQANYLLGGVLLECDDESGLDMIRRAMDLDAKWKYAASDVAFQYLRSKGRLEEAAEYARILESQATELENAQRERQQVSPDDGFLPHDFEPQTIADIVRKLRYYEEIVSIYLVRKDVQFLKEHQFNVLFIEMRKASRFKRSDDMTPTDLIEAVARRLEDFEIGFFAALTGEFANMKPRLDTIPGSRIFDRAEEEVTA